jgi:bifunctional DNA-binding transcriptional regulator/antitoxin component of YhaV-PrlF toxin-antitoxin module
LEEVIEMALIRLFARVDKDGKVTIPNNVSRQVGFKLGQLVEVKVVGKRITISARDNAR